MKKVRHTIKQIAETPLSEVYGNDKKTIEGAQQDILDIHDTCVFKDEK